MRGMEWNDIVHSLHLPETSDQVQHFNGNTQSDVLEIGNLGEED
jgi:hypothetical protein